MGRFLAPSSVKRRATPSLLCLLMATTMENKDLALNASSANSPIVADDGSSLPQRTTVSKSSMSTKLSRKKSACPPKVDADLRPFGTNIPSPLKSGTNIPPPIPSDWATSSQEGNPHMIPPGAPGYDKMDNSVIPPTGQLSPLTDTQDVIAPTTGPFCPVPHLDPVDTIAEDTDDTEVFHEVQSTPPGPQPPIGRQLYLKDKITSPDHFTVGINDVPMEEGHKPRRKRRNQAKTMTSKTKVPKPLPGPSNGTRLENQTKPNPTRPKLKPILFENFWQSTPDYFVRNTPNHQPRTNMLLSGEVPSTPLNLIPDTDEFNAKAGMQAILATRPVHTDTVWFGGVYWRKNHF
ncbi:hypothetical protein AVEN_69514-1 [Araneus ventricosus]|uniref:Uncharacterized protein n=1 Tax=Araneus ventricosus TaxID=182803 RepID=A0A4Y2TTV3_ARAVE|nr:hypothetical protein AVEN_69514-1 [Araneus ventricosus]